MSHPSPILMFSCQWPMVSVGHMLPGAVAMAPSRISSMIVVVLLFTQLTDQHVVANSYLPT